MGYGTGNSEENTPVEYQTAEPITVLYRIYNKSAYGMQEFVVLSREPVFKYVKKGNLLLAEDSGFYNAYGYERPTQYSKAFGGREFDIPMLDGTVIKASGEWWACAHPEAKNVVDHGYGTIEGLMKCYVYTGSSGFNKDLLNTCKTEPIDYREFEKILKGGKL